MSRLLVFLLGLAVVALGWAIHDPAIAARFGAGAIFAAILNAGLEPFRQLIAGGTGTLGALLLLGSITGHRGKPKPKSRAQAYRPQALVFDAADPAPAVAAELTISEPAPVEAAPVAEEVFAEAVVAEGVVDAPLDAMASPPEPEAFPGEPELAPVALAEEAPFPAEAPVLETPLETPVVETPVIEAVPIEVVAEPIALDHGPEVDLTPAAVVATPVLETPEPEPAPEPASSPAPEVEPEAGPETFDDARQHLRALAREENWPAVGRVLGRLPRLAATEAEQALAAQDLGVFHRSQGRSDDAAEAFERALGHARGAEPADPALLAASLTDVGDVALEQSRLEAAINAYVELVDIRRTVAAADPSPDNRRLLSLALERLADAREDRGHRTRALTLYQESMAIAGDLAAADPARYGADLAVTRRRLAELEAALAN